MANLNRRTFLRGLTAGGALVAGGSLLELELERAFAQNRADAGKPATRPNFIFMRDALDTPLLAAGRKERNGAAVGEA